MNKENREYIKIFKDVLSYRLNILMIDDQKENLSAFKGQFRRDANIFIASNKNEAINVVNSNKIDHIFCDYRMPNHNGDEILKEIKYLFPNIKSTVLSAYITSSMISDFKKKTGVTDFLEKPYSGGDILSRVFGEQYQLIK